MTTVINFFGAPSSGKSVIAAYTFAMLKVAGVNAELIREFAKEKVWEGNDAALGCQTYITAKQVWKMHQVAKDVNVIVTDSPLPTGLLYPTKDCGPGFDMQAWHIFNTYSNINFMNLLSRGEYQQEGRDQDEEGAIAVQAKLTALLKSRNIQYTAIVRQPVEDTPLAHIPSPS
jgi:nicotinamide riboside kinase